MHKSPFFIGDKASKHNQEKEKQKSWNFQRLLSCLMEDKRKTGIIK